MGKQDQEVWDWLTCHTVSRSSPVGVEKNSGDGFMAFGSGSLGCSIKAVFLNTESLTLHLPDWVRGSSSLEGQFCGIRMAFLGDSVKSLLLLQPFLKKFFKFQYQSLSV